MPDRTTSPIDDDRITAYGMMVEASRRLQRTFDRTLRQEHGLSSVAFEALLRIGRSEGRQISMSDLGMQMVLTSGGVTRLIDRLEKAGLVERRRCAEDRRVQWAHLTSDGIALTEAATRTHLADLQDHFVAEMTSEEYDVVANVMDRLRTECPVTDLR